MRGIAIRRAMTMLLAITLSGPFVAADDATAKPKVEKERGKSRPAALLLIRRERSYVVTPPPPPHAGEYEEYIATQEQLLRSALVLGPVVAREEIKGLPSLKENPDPVAWIAQRLKFVRRKESEVFSVSLRHDNASETAAIVNAVIDSYFKIVDEHDAQRNVRTTQLLEVERDAQRAKLERSSESVRALRAEIRKAKAGSDVSGLEFDLELREFDLQLDREVFEKLRRRIIEVQTEQRAPRRVTLLQSAIASPAMK